MYRYPKQILTIEQQVQSYVDAGMETTSHEEVEKALKIRGSLLEIYTITLSFNSAIIICSRRSISGNTTFLPLE